jgi:hypothetical protein
MSYGTGDEKMSWIPFLDQLAALNDISSTITSFFGSFLSNIVSIVSSVVMMFFYPVVLMFNLGYGDIQYIYTTGAQFLNLILGIPSYVSTMFSVWVPTSMPSVWTLLFLLSVGIATFARAMRLLTWLKGWIPIIFG